MSARAGAPGDNGVDVTSKRDCPRPGRARHRKVAKRDHVLVGLQAGAFLAAGGLVGVLLLILGGGPEPGNAPRAEEQALSFTRPATPTSRTPSPAAVAPTSTAVGVKTLVTARGTITLSPPAASTSQPVTPGAACEVDGQWSVTGVRPVVCHSVTPGGPLRWQPVY
ncbi:MAG: hypothetical protein M3443_04055 [Actinomycetota bacterium]|nr:hypothetical protein [Actinomycetota bacterium]